MFSYMYFDPIIFSRSVTKFGMNRRYKRKSLVVFTLPVNSSAQINKMVADLTPTKSFATRYQNFAQKKLLVDT